MIDTGKKWGIKIKFIFSKAGMTVDEAYKGNIFFFWRNWLMGLCNLKETTTTSVKFKVSCTVLLYPLRE